MKKRFAILMLSAVISLLAGCSESTATNETVSSYSETESDPSQLAVTTTTTITTEPAVTTDTTSSGSDFADDTENQVQKSRLDNCKYIQIDKDKSMIFPQNEKFGVFSATSSSKWAFYRFSDTGIVGIAPDDVKLMFDDNDDRFNNRINVKYLEMYFGLKANIENNILEVNSYDNTNKAVCNNIEIYDGNKQLMDESSNGTLSVNLENDINYINGAYAIKGTFSYDMTEYTAYLYLIVNCKSDDPADFEFYICYADGNAVGDNLPSTYITDLQKFIEDNGITDPYTQAISSKIRYPNEATNMAGGKFDTDYWVAKSYEIIKGNENKSDAYKALLLHDLMTENLIYDDYKVNVLKEARYYNDYVSGKYYVSKINIGVCRDFSNIYAIMCREQGIPCIMLNPASRKHVWNAIYVDNRWYEVDLTDDIARHATTESITDVTPADFDNTHNYSGFCNYKYNTDSFPEEVNGFLHPMY